jgi:hypothetical protein
MISRVSMDIATPSGVFCSSLVPAPAARIGGNPDALARTLHVASVRAGSRYIGSSARALCAKAR